MYPMNTRGIFAHQPPTAGRSTGRKIPHLALQRIEAPVPMRSVIRLAASGIIDQNGVSVLPIVSKRGDSRSVSSN